MVSCSVVLRVNALLSAYHTAKDVCKLIQQQGILRLHCSKILQ